MSVFVLDHLWQSTLFGLAAAVLTLALRRNRAAIRYAIWLAASLKFLAPLGALAPAGAYIMQSLRQPGSPVLQPVRLVAEPFASGELAPLDDSVLEISVRDGLDALTVVAVLWLAGAVVIALIRLGRTLQLARLVRSATPAAMKLPIRVSFTQAPLEPGLFGVVRPVLLLPAGIEESLTSEELDAVVAHELCHWRRGDNLTGALHMVVETLFWFHPLVWWIGRRLIAEREKSCDEAVVEAGTDRQTYAGSILKVCRVYLHSQLACAAGISGADLKRRVRDIMAARQSGSLGMGKTLMLGACAVGVLTLPIALGAAALPVPAPRVTLPSKPHVVTVAVARTPSSELPPLRPVARPVVQTLRQPASAEPCADTACGTTAPEIQAATLAPTCSPFPCKVVYVGAARIPSHRPFVEYWDGTKPRLIRGALIGVEWGEPGATSEFLVRSDEDGRMWRVVGGDARGLGPETRASVLPGAALVVRGYEAHDKSCDGGACLISGQNIQYADGAPMFAGDTTR